MAKWKKLKEEKDSKKMTKKKNKHLNSFGVFCLFSLREAIISWMSAQQEAKQLMCSNINSFMILRMKTLCNIIYNYLSYETHL